MHACIHDSPIDTHAQDHVRAHLKTHYIISRRNLPYVGMSYSYVAVGSTGEDYDVIADTSHGHIHFAGEVSPYVFLCAIRYNYY